MVIFLIGREQLVSFQVLGDIEIAQGIERDKEKKQKEVIENL